MKNKKIIYLIISIALILGIIAGTVLFKGNDSKIKEVDGVAELKVSSQKPPVFSIDIVGAYTGTFTDYDIEEKDIKVYEFVTTMTTGFGKVTNTYTGVKLADVLNKLQIDNYTQINFKNDRFDVLYQKDELEEDAFLVFTRDGKDITSDGPVTLLAPQYKYRYSLENVTTLEFIDTNIYDEVPETEPTSENEPNQE